MSSALAIAAVTAALRQQLGDLYRHPDVSPNFDGLVSVSAQVPSEVSASETESPQLNIFLYRISPNVGWINVDLPVRNNTGGRVNAPPLALDLYYLLTAYSAQNFEAEAVLGYAMQMLHESPGLDRRQLRDMATDTMDTRVRELLVLSQLAEQVEPIKFTMQALDGEEIFKIWSSFQTHYRPSAAYHASVVLIESEKPTRTSLPVNQPRIHIKQLRRPRIESITPQIVSSGESISVQGDSFVATTVQIKFAGLTAQNIIPESDQEITLALPAGLKVGINTVQVLHPIDIAPGAAPDLRSGSDSNVGVFLLAPRIVTAPTEIAAGDRLSLEVEPPIDGNQRVTLLMGDRAIDIPPRLLASGEPETTNTLEFPISSDFIREDPYLIRLRIDGAESQLTVDANNLFNGPELTIR